MYKLCFQYFLLYEHNTWYYHKEIKSSEYAIETNEKEMINSVLKKMYHQPYNPQ